MLDPIQLPSLKNNYYVMRHGQSQANTAGIIVSDPKNGLNGYGLSDLGRKQVKANISLSSLTADTRIISSDFKRTRETTDIVQQCINCNQHAILDERLRERFFGDLELQSDTRYAEVWAQDRQVVDCGELDAESVHSVAKRASKVIFECESKLTGENCLLIAHGDILQILQTVFYGLPATHHRDLPPLDTAEIRRLQKP